MIVRVPSKSTSICAGYSCHVHESTHYRHRCCLLNCVLMTSWMVPLVFILRDVASIISKKLKGAVFLNLVYVRFHFCMVNIQLFICKCTDELCSLLMDFAKIMQSCPGQNVCVKAMSFKGPKITANDTGFQPCPWHLFYQILWIF